MNNWLIALVNAVRAALPKSHHELVLLIIELTFILWVLMESAHTLIDIYLKFFGGLS
jgi:hypothetical protein